MATQSTIPAGPPLASSTVPGPAQTPGLGSGQGRAAASLLSGETAAGAPAAAGLAGIAPNVPEQSRSDLGRSDAGRTEAGVSMHLAAPMARMPVALSVGVPVRDFRVRNLLAIARGTVVETQWGQGEDLPLSSGDLQLAWSEFEVVDTRLAVRVTRLA